MHGNPILTSANAYLSVTNFAGATPIQQLTGLPLGTGDGTATGPIGLKVILIGSGGSTASLGTVTNVPKGAANFATGQVTATTAAGTFVAARATRRSATLINADSTINIYVGPATVTAGNGLLLKPSQSVNVDTTALIQVLAASGTPTVTFIESYD